MDKIKIKKAILNENDRLNCFIKKKIEYNQVVEELECNILKHNDIKWKSGFLPVKNVYWNAPIKIDGSSGITATFSSRTKPYIEFIVERPTICARNVHNSLVCK